MNSELLKEESLSTSQKALTLSKIPFVITVSEQRLKSYDQYKDAQSLFKSEGAKRIFNVENKIQVTTSAASVMQPLPTFKSVFTESKIQTAETKPSFPLNFLLQKSPRNFCYLPSLEKAAFLPILDPPPFKIARYCPWLLELHEKRSNGIVSKTGSNAFLCGKAYESRNVYKSIVRHLFLYVKKNEDDIRIILEEAGFSSKDIKECFNELEQHDKSVKSQSFRINPQVIIKRMIGTNSIRAHVLRETLFAMLHNLERGKLGRVTRKNTAIYKYVCSHYYEEAVKITNQRSKARTLFL